LPYKVVIKKCEDSRRAALIAEEVSRWSGVAKDTVNNAIINKNLCIKIETEKDEALELKNKFIAVGATVKLIEYDITGEPTLVDSQRSISEENYKRSPSKAEHIGLLQKLKTDIVIFGKKKKDGKKEKGIKEKKLKRREKNGKEIGQELSDLLITSEYRNEYIKELFRSLRTKVLMGLHDYKDKSLVVTSLDAGSGKSTMVSNIGISISQQNKNTLLIDGDMRRGSLHSFFKTEQSPGLSDFLISEDTISGDYINSFLKTTHVPGLCLLTSGQYVHNSSELLTSDRFIQLKKILAERFKIIILDTPPLGAVTDAVVVNEIFSRYLIIVKAEATNVVDMKKKINEYPALREKIAGLVLNYAALDKIRSYYKRSKYY